MTESPPDVKDGPTLQEVLDTKAPTGNADTPTPEQMQILQLITRMEELHHAITSELRSEAFLNAVVNKLAGHPALAPFLDRLILQRLQQLLPLAVESIKNQTNDNGFQLTGYHVEILESEPPVDDLALFRVSRKPADHPTHPHGLELYLRHEDSWTHIDPVGEAVATILHRALDEEGKEDGKFFFCRINQVFDPAAKEAQPA